MDCQVVFNVTTKTLDQLSDDDLAIIEALKHRQRAKERAEERKQAAIALLKQRAEHDPVIEAIVAVLGL
jgi:hypothetical protein